MQGYILLTNKQRDRHTNRWTDRCNAYTPHRKGSMCFYYLAYYPLKKKLKAQFL